MHARMQVRDWINHSLYGPDDGYFNQFSSPVGQLPEPILFSKLAGQQAYLQQLRLWYDKLKVCHAFCHTLFGMISDSLV